MISGSVPTWFSLLLLFLSAVMLLIMKPKKMKLPPGPPKLAIIGNMLHLIGGIPHQTLFQLSKKYGPVMHIQLGGVPTVVISSPRAAEKVFRTYEANCRCRPPFLGAQRITYNYCDLAFSPYNDYYKKIKKICNIEVFSSQRVQTFRFIREEEVAFLIDSISQSCPSETPVNLSEMLMSFIANLVCRIAFGKSIQERGLKNFNYQAIRDAMQMIENIAASDFFPYLGWIIDKFRWLDRRYEKVFLELDSFCQQLIDDRLSNEKQTREHEDIIDVLLKIQRNQTGSDLVQLTDDHIKALLVDIFLGGVDTSAITIVWAMAELARNPNVMKKAQEEIRNCVGSRGKVSQNDIDKFPYFKAVIKETLRLHPPGPLIPRQVITKFQLEGYDVYPKTQIQVNIWALGRDPKIWERPEEYMPDRFVDSSVDFKGQNFEYLPFGSGRRMCPGMNMATNNIEITLANLLHFFDWKLPSGMTVKDINMEEKFGTTTNKKTALKLVPVKYVYPLSNNIT